MIIRKPRSIQSIDRALNILEAFDCNQRILGVTELSKKLGLHKSTTFNLLTTLGGHGWVEQDPSANKYKLGLKVFTLATVVEENMYIRTLADPHMLQLVKDYGETVNLAVLVDGQALFIHKKESVHPEWMMSQVGTRLPVHSTGVGKALIAFMDTTEVDHIISSRSLIRFTPHTITDPHILKEQLQEIRSQGYAVDNQETMEGFIGVAVPLLGANGKALAAISIAALVQRLRGEKLLSAVQSLLRVSRDISEKLRDHSFCPL